MNQGLPSSKPSSWPSTQSGSLSSASASSSKHRKCYGKKLPTKEPNNTKELQKEAYSKQQSSTEKETEEQSWMKESGRRKTGQSEYLKTTDEYFKNRRRILQKTATGEGSSNDEIEDERLQNISDIFYSRIKEIGVRTG